MDQRISLITLGVADLAVAKDFYERVLGWEAIPGPPEIAFFDLNGLVFSLYPHAKLADDIGITASGDGNYGGATLAYNARSIDEVDRLFADLKAKGATIIKEPESVFWGGYSGYFADPDGHHWEVAFNPYWTVLDDGRISMEPQ